MDTGARLAAAGYRVDLLPSTTMEEAPVKAKMVDKQQRWWKGRLSPDRAGAHSPAGCAPSGKWAWPGGCASTC